MGSEESQFHLRNKVDLIKLLHTSKSVNDLYELTQVYDDNFYFFSKALENAFKKTKVYKDEGVEKWFLNSLEVSYHLNMAIRMLATLEDLLIKISVNSFIIDNNIAHRFIDDVQSARKYYYNNNIKNDINYPDLPNVKNRATRKLRHHITHDGDIILKRGLVKEKGMQVVLGDEGYYDRNLEAFNEIYDFLESDINKVIDNKLKLEPLVERLIKDELRKVNYK